MAHWIICNLYLGEVTDDVYYLSVNYKQLFRYYKGKVTYIQTPKPHLGGSQLLAFGWWHVDLEFFFRKKAKMTS